MGRKKTNEGLYLRKDSKFFWMSFSGAGRHYNKSTGTADKALAKKIFAKTTVMIQEGKWFDVDHSTKYTYDELMDKFIAEHAPSVSANTQLSYGYSRKHLDHYFSGMSLSEIDSKKVSEYRIWRRDDKDNPCRPSTRNCEVAMLAKACALAVHPWGMMKHNPCYRLSQEPTDNAHTGQALPENAEEAVLLQCKKHLDGQLEEMARIAIHSGCRRKEVALLRYDRINLDLRQFSVIQKGNTLKVCGMTDTVHSILSGMNKVQNISGYVFVNPKTGKPWNLDTVSKKFKKAASDAGLPNFRRFHNLRHTCGTRLGQAGKDIRTIAEILGHSKLETSRRYIKNDTKEKTRVLNDVFEAKKKVVNE